MTYKYRPTYADFVVDSSDPPESPLYDNRKFQDKQYGSVFSPAVYGGPSSWSGRGSLAERRSGLTTLTAPAVARFPRPLPDWSDKRKPGNTNVNEKASEILSRFSDAQQKRFQSWMEDQSLGSGDMGTPWGKEWLERTTDNWNDSKLDIVKCKLELIRRLSRIKISGPQSLEDWITIFMVEDGMIRIPESVTEWVIPEYSKTYTGAKTDISFLKWKDSERHRREKIYSRTGHKEKYPGLSLDRNNAQVYRSTSNIAPRTQTFRQMF